MRFFCWKCSSEVESLFGTCRYCGTEQDIDPRIYFDKLRGALGHPVAETRRRAIFLLGEKRAVQAIDDLSRIVAGESDIFLAEEAAIALGKINDERALSALTAAARHRSFIARARALRALAEAGGYWSRLAQKWARSDPSAIIRATGRVRP
jgi:HEAT repeat protein